MPNPLTDPPGTYWVDGAGGGTALSASNLNNRELARTSAVMFQPFGEPATTGATPPAAVWFTGQVTKATLRVVGAPTTGACTALVRRNGATIATLTIAAGSTIPNSATLSIAVIDGDLIDVSFTGINGATGVIVQVIMSTVPAAIGSYTSLILAESSLVSAWGLAESSGTAAADRTTLHAGVYQGAPTLSQASLVSGGDSAVLFNGTTQYVSIAGSAGLQAVSPGMEAWIRPASVAQSVIMSMADDCFVLSISITGKLQAQFWNGTTNRALVGNATLSINTTYHVAADWNDTSKNLTVYVNGVQDNQINYAAQSIVYTGGVTTSAIAAGSTGASKHNGRIDEPAYYGTPGTATRWLSHYNRGIGIA